MPDTATAPLNRELITLLDGALKDSVAPIYIAIDGHSGSGKSTLAAAISRHYGAQMVSVISSDDFYSGGTAEQWDNRSVEQNTQAVINWQKLKTIITTLKTTAKAHWFAFDWHSDHWDSAAIPFEKKASSAVERHINIIEGVYSARAELADLYDFTILLIVSARIRSQRIIDRDGNTLYQRWNERWSDAENLYFNRICFDNFDLQLDQNQH